MRTRWTFGALFIAALLALPSVVAQEEKEAEKEKDKVNLEEIKCPISGRAIDEERTVEISEDAKVYFCCPNCVAAFKKDPRNEKFAAKVRYQLAATKQAKQQACPFSGAKLNEDTAIEVGYAKVPVAFCCEKCQAKANGVKEADNETSDKLIALIFADEKKFAKAFKIGEEKEEEKEGESDEN